MITNNHIRPSFYRLNPLSSAQTPAPELSYSTLPGNVSLEDLLRTINEMSPAVGANPFGHVAATLANMNETWFQENRDKFVAAMDNDGKIAGFVIALPFNQLNQHAVSMPAPIPGEEIIPMPYLAEAPQEFSSLGNRLNSTSFISQMFVSLDYDQSTVLKGILDFIKSSKPELTGLTAKTLKSNNNLQQIYENAGLEVVRETDRNKLHYLDLSK